MKQYSRRAFMKTGLMIGGAAALTACTPAATNAPTAVATEGGAPADGAELHVAAAHLRALPVRQVSRRQSHASSLLRCVDRERTQR